LRNVDLLITSDNHGGLKKAIQKQFHGTSWQRCQTHFSKNLLDKTPPKIKAEVKDSLTDLYNAPSIKDAQDRKEQMLDSYREQAPKAMTLLDESLNEVTAVFSLPAAYRKRLRTSNGIERLNEELRRRERVIWIFSNETSMIRLMGAVLMEHHEKWSSVKKYFTMDCYFAEQEEARKTAQVERSKRVHTVY